MENNNYQLKIFPLARLDMEQIFNHIAVNLSNPTAVINQINDFEKAFANICIFPAAVFACAHLCDVITRFQCSLRRMQESN